MVASNEPTTDTRYFNREISWLAFNTRVLEEAKNANYPLLERLRFLSISANNLDEFYMVRVAGLRTQVIAGLGARSLDGLTPDEQLRKIRKRTKKLSLEQQAQWKSLRKDLASENIKVKQVDDLSDKELKTLKKIYDAEIMPLLTPLAIDPAHPFPFIPNLGFGLVLSLGRKKKRDSRKALLIAPAHK